MVDVIDIVVVATDEEWRFLHHHIQYLQPWVSRFIVVAGQAVRQFPKLSAVMSNNHDKLSMLIVDQQDVLRMKSDGQLSSRHPSDETTQIHQLNAILKHPLVAQQVSKLQHSSSSIVMVSSTSNNFPAPWVMEMLNQQQSVAHNAIVTKKATGACYAQVATITAAYANAMKKTTGLEDLLKNPEHILQDSKKISLRHIKQPRSPKNAFDFWMKSQPGLKNAADIPAAMDNVLPLHSPSFIQDRLSIHAHLQSLATQWSLLPKQDQLDFEMRAHEDECRFTSERDCFDSWAKGDSCSHGKTFASMVETLGFQIKLYKAVGGQHPNQSPPSSINSTCDSTQSHGFVVLCASSNSFTSVHQPGNLLCRFNDIVQLSSLADDLSWSKSQHLDAWLGASNSPMDRQAVQQYHASTIEELESKFASITKHQNNNIPVDQKTWSLAAFEHAFLQKSSPHVDQKSSLVSQESPLFGGLSSVSMTPVYNILAKHHAKMFCIPGTNDPIALTAHEKQFQRQLYLSVSNQMSVVEFNVKKMEDSTQSATDLGACSSLISDIVGHSRHCLVMQDNNNRISSKAIDLSKLHVIRHKEPSSGQTFDFSQLSHHASDHPVSDCLVVSRFEYDLNQLVGWILTQLNSLKLIVIDKTIFSECDSNPLSAVTTSEMLKSKVIASGTEWFVLEDDSVSIVMTSTQSLPLRLTNIPDMRCSWGKIGLYGKRGFHHDNYLGQYETSDTSFDILLSSPRLSMNQSENIRMIAKHVMLCAHSPSKIEIQIKPGESTATSFELIGFLANDAHAINNEFYFMCNGKQIKSIAVLSDQTRQENRQVEQQLLLPNRRYVLECRSKTSEWAHTGWIIIPSDPENQS
jgi:hypothetical protein